jgi:hypothetical protein
MGQETGRETPEARAERAAEELDAEGLAVTARAVRERAGVRMGAAAAAARRWARGRLDAAGAPEPPAGVAARFDAVWRDAWRAARAELDAERAGWLRRVDAAESEAAALGGDVERLEAELAAETARSRADAERLQAEVAGAREAAAAAEGAAAGLREALAALKVSPARKAR